MLKKDEFVFVIFLMTSTDQPEGPGDDPDFKFNISVIKNYIVKFSSIKLGFYLCDG
jgi:hypothetical protein